MAPPQTGDLGSTATGQARLGQLIDRYADRRKAKAPSLTSGGAGVPHRAAPPPARDLLPPAIDAADCTAVHHDPACPHPEDLKLISADTTVGCADVSPHWADQLAEDGRLLVPLRHAASRR